MWQHTSHADSTKDGFVPTHIVTTLVPTQQFQIRIHTQEQSLINTHTHTHTPGTSAAYYDKFS